jgi:penicillin-binding protein A
MPGSTFKVITTGIALENGAVALDSVFAEEREWVPPQTDDPIQNYNRSLCGGDLATVFARSCNIPFAQLAVLLGPEAMVAGAEAWGMGEPLPIDLPRPAASTFGSTDNLSQELPLLAIRGFGQSEVQMVPLHMAMVAATVANGGQMMVPYAVESTFDEEGRVLDETRPQVWKTPISPQTAEIERQLMIGVAERGTASCCIALNGGIPVAAKTGTAELGVDRIPICPTPGSSPSRRPTTRSTRCRWYSPTCSRPPTRPPPAVASPDRWRRACSTSCSPGPAPRCPRRTRGQEDDRQPAAGRGR